MNAFTKMSEKGQVVVPKALRLLKNWPAGTDLEVIDAGDGVLLRPRRTAIIRLSVEEAVHRLRDIYQHRGPPISLEQMKVDVADEAVERDHRSR